MLARLWFVLRMAVARSYIRNTSFCKWQWHCALWTTVLNKPCCASYRYFTGRNDRSISSKAKKSSNIQTRDETYECLQILGSVKPNCARDRRHAVALAKPLRVSTSFFTMDLILDNKKHRKSSLEPGKHEKQLFISNRSLQTYRKHQFTSIGGLILDCYSLEIQGKLSCFWSWFRTKTSQFSNFPVPNAYKKLFFVVFRFQRTFPIFFMNWNQLFREWNIETLKFCS